MEADDMKEIRELNVTEDESIQRTLVIVSLIILVVATMTVLLVYFLLSDWHLEFNLLDILVGLLLSIIVLPIHETIHGAFFRLVGIPSEKIRFGYTKGMLYASAEGQLFTRRQYALVVGAPFVIISALLILLSSIPSMTTAAMIAVVFHASGCAGDLYYLWVMAREPKITHARDTSTGVTFYGEKNISPDDSGTLPER